MGGSPGVRIAQYAAGSRAQKLPVGCSRTPAGGYFFHEGAEFRYGGPDHSTGAGLLAYTFHVDAQDSHYFVNQGLDQWRDATPYSGTAWVDPVSFEVRQLMVRTGPEVSNTVCEVTTIAGYKRLRIGDSDIVMPTESRFRTLLVNGAAVDAESVYSGCRKSQSEPAPDSNNNPDANPGNEPDVNPVAGAKDEANVKESVPCILRYCEPPEEEKANGAKFTISAPASIPAGLSFDLALTDPIDTDTAAAGDMVTATVQRPLLDRSTKAVLIPAGAKVRGRIIRMEKYISDSGRPSAFLIALELETVEINGARRPFYARPYASFGPDSGPFVSIAPIVDSVAAGAWTFRSIQSSYIVPAGYPSLWITTEAPR